MTRSALAAMSALLFLGVPVAACGGEGGRAPAATPAAVAVDEPSGTARVTDPARAAYIRRADRVCAALDPEREGKLQEVEGAEDPAGTYADTVTLAAEQLRRIEALTPPAADAHLIARNVLDRLRSRLVLRKRLRSELAGGDERAAARDQAQYEALGIAVRSFARGYGFKECGTR